MSTITIIQGNSNDKDNTRAYMVKGEAGVSPTVSVERTTGGAIVTTTDYEGTHTAQVNDGVSPTVETSKTGGVTTITITDYEGEHTATIDDGETYEVPTGSIIGFEGSTIPTGYEEIDDYIKVLNASETIYLGAGIDLYDKVTNFSVPAGYKAIGIVGYDLVGLYYSHCFFARLKIENNSVRWAIKNTATSDIPSLTITFYILAIRN